MAGDTASDVESGLRAGARLVAGVLTGAASREELEQAGAPHVLPDITGLIALLGLGPQLPPPGPDQPPTAPGEPAPELAG
ncbi:MAG: HAD family hydrolase [Streptosporangiaceae bacterium]